jgi:hypothetical protein
VRCSTHVTAMVCAVEIDPVPAGWEEGLCSHAVTWGRGQAVRVATATAVISQAYVLYGLLGEVRFVDGSKVPSGSVIKQNTDCL